MALTDIPVLKFVRKAGGTGATLSTTYLGFDGDEVTSGNNQMIASWAAAADGVLSKIIVSTFYFAAEPNFVTDPYYQVSRKSAVEYLETIRSALYWRPLNVKSLARGIAVIPHTREQWGDLINESNGNAVLLANCALIDAEIVDDAGLYGVQVQFTFGKVAASAAP